MSRNSTDGLHALQARPCITVCTVAVFTAWAIAIATPDDTYPLVVAVVLTLPVSLFVEQVLLLTFALLSFDPTTAAPAWQTLLTALVTVVCTTAAAAGQALLVQRVMNRACPRRITRHA